MFKTKSQTFLGANSYVCRSYRRKTGWGAFPPPAILNRVKISYQRNEACTLSEVDSLQIYNLYFFAFFLGMKKEADIQGEIFIADIFTSRIK